MPQAEPVLICALSGRALAQSARAAGFAPIVLDAFADLDTRDAAAAWRRLPVDRHWRFRRGALLAAARGWRRPRYRWSGARASSAAPIFWPNSLTAVRSGATGRAASGRSRTRSAWPPWPESLDIAHPEVREAPPADLSGWLCKRAGGAGGGHVRRAARTRPRGRGWYWQRRVRGRPVSALVVGSTGTARVVGFSEQWATPLHGRGFRYGGAVAPAALSAAAAASLAAAAEALVTHYALVGLASVDALVAGDAVTVLEINPRPGASLDAYERGLGINLFRLHHAACLGTGAEVPLPRASCGRLADRLCAPVTAIPVGFAWPAWTADRTPPGSRIEPGGPICTVLAEAGDTLATRALLAVHAGTLHAALERLDVTPTVRRSSNGERRHG